MNDGPLVVRLNRHGTTVWNSVVLGLVHVMWGLSLALSSSRWTATPAYANLFALLAPWVWGCVYLVGALGLLAGAFLLRNGRGRALIRAAIAYNFVLTLAWGAAFLVRYLTSSSTTPFTFGSSIVQLYLLARASLWLNRDRPPSLR